VVCRQSVDIGSGTEFGPNVLVYDHDHEWRGGALKEGNFLTDSVFIGKNCWIGAGCIVLRGTRIGDGCVVAAGSVLKGEYPTGSLIYQRRETVVRDIG
jgi:acetyltransferase-like isoleucine patch superfamily enzyme